MDDWQVMGDNGAPVLTHKKPVTGRTFPISSPPDSGEFNGNRLGLQWQWQANPQPNWAFPSSGLGVLRPVCTLLPEVYRNFWEIPNLLLPKFPAPTFSATTKLTFTANNDGEDAWILSREVVLNADRGSREREVASAPVKDNTLYLRVTAVCRFSFSNDGSAFENIGGPFTSKPGSWIGAKVGLFAVRPGLARESGCADYDWVRVE